MIPLQSILDAYADAHGETLQSRYDQGDSPWAAPLTVWGSDVTW